MGGNANFVLVGDGGMVLEKVGVFCDSRWL